MKKLFLLASLLPGLALAGEQPKKPIEVAKPNPCAKYGEGWVQVKGSDTCVKVSGYVRVDVGR
jgi:hypothetical protein